MNRLFFAALGLSASLANAVEPPKVLDKYSLVGVISESQAGVKGIAVIRDNEGERTLTLKAGDSLPGDSAFKLQTVERKRVILSDGTEKVALEFNGRSVEKENKDEESPLKTAALRLERKPAVVEVEDEEEWVEDSDDEDIKEARLNEALRNSVESIPAKEGTTTKIIWPGGDDKITFSDIDAHNRLMQRMEADAKKAEVRLEQEVDGEAEEQEYQTNEYQQEMVGPFDGEDGH